MSLIHIRLHEIPTLNAKIFKPTVFDLMTQQKISIHVELKLFISLSS